MPNEDDIEAAAPKGEKAVTKKLDSINSIMDGEAKELLRLRANRKASSAMIAVWKESLKLKQVRATTRPSSPAKSDLLPFQSRGNNRAIQIIGGGDDDDEDDSSTSSSSSPSAHRAATTTPTPTIPLDRASLLASLRPNTANTEGMSDYELLRLQKIQRNEAKLASLGLCGITTKNTTTGGNNNNNATHGTVDEYTTNNTTICSKTVPFAATAQSSRGRNLLGPDWECHIDESYCRSWISPTQNIEFTNLEAAREFEELRKQFGDDDALAYEEYQKLHPPSPLDDDDDAHRRRRWSVLAAAAAAVAVTPEKNKEDTTTTTLLLRSPSFVSTPGRGDHSGSKTTASHHHHHDDDDDDDDDQTSTIIIQQEAAVDNTLPSCKPPTVVRALMPTPKHACNTRLDPPMRDTVSENKEESDYDNDSCFICGDGGDLVLCSRSDCSKAFHMECHIPRLDRIPQGSWSCCECRAGTYKRRQRCGECEQCLRPNCGECGPCKGKKQFGGNGKWNNSCELRRCNSMRFAPPESVPNTTGRCSTAEGGSTVLLSKAKKLTRGNASRNNKSFAGSKRARGCIRASVASKSIRSNGQDCATSLKKKKKNDASKSLPLNEYSGISPKKKPPGPGWTPKRVYESGQVRHYWISPMRQIEFKRHTAACNFESLRRKFQSDEFKAWPAYRKRYYSRGGASLSVVSPQNYDDHPESGILSRASPGCSRESTTNHASVNNTNKDATTKSTWVGRNASHCKAKGPPGQGWTPKSVYERGRNRCHWISPIRQIEFKTHIVACKFESLRRKFHSDEVKAWEEFKKQYNAMGKMSLFVVSPQKYYAPPESGKTQMASPVEGASSRSDNICCVCDDGGELVLCDNCQRAFHKECHSTKLHNIPRGKWRCSKCTAGLSKKRQRSIDRVACLVKESCEEHSGRNTKCGEQCKKLRLGMSTCCASQEKTSSKRLRPTKTNEISTLICNSRSNSTKSLVPQPRNGRGTLVTGSKHHDPQSRSETCESDELCYICDDGGDLVLCDYCPKAFHMECNVPKLHEIPPGDWMCCECKAARCGECEACLRPDACGQCTACKTKVRFGGTVKLGGKQCELKRCKEKQYAAPEGSSTMPHGINGASTLNKRGAKAVRSIKSKKQSVSKSIVQFGQASESRFLASPFHQYSKLRSDDGLNCDEIKVICLRPNNKESFFGQRFPNRVYRVVKNLRDKPPEKILTLNGAKYFLASAKVNNEKSRGGGKGRFIAQDKTIEMLYVGVDGLEAKLEKLCSFSSLPPEKAVARLGHLQSEAKNVLYIKCSDIEVIDENGHEGCGFFPDGYFDQYKNQVDSMQVRLLGPKLGFAKGMLLKKRGISRIQLPISMIKAPSSQKCNDSYVALIIKNVFPSQENKQLGRFLDPVADAQESWTSSSKKPLSDMYQRMLVGFGAKESDVKKYAQSVKGAKMLKHAHLKGCVDPTGALPQNKVFITGYTKDSNSSRILFGKAHAEIFLSRSPCLAPTDAKMVSVVSSRPANMSMDDWKMLCSYGFGTIIFPQSKKSLACIIADGDLDGDDYFVLWDKSLIRQLLHSNDMRSSKARALLCNLEPPHEVQRSMNKERTFEPNKEGGWLGNAQDLMLDFCRQLKAPEMVGKLYKLCVHASKRDGWVDLCNKDAIAYASAYKDAMDVQKHGGKIYLPQHLHENLPKGSRYLLTSSLE